MYFPLASFTTPYSFDDNDLSSTDIQSNSSILEDKVSLHQIQIESLNSDEGTSLNNYKKIKCTQCRKRFDTEDEMEEHREKHSSETQFACAVCGKKFSSPSSVWKHIKSHSGERPFICEVCKKGFTQLANLQRHYLVHTGSKPYECPSCNKMFSQHANMVKHQLLHSGEKPFRCKLCEKSFAQRANLKKHEMIHLGLKPHNCSICLKSYAQYANLKKHLLVHSKEQQTRDFVFVYQCTECHVIYDKASDYESHVRAMHGMETVSAAVQLKRASVTKSAKGEKNETILIVKEEVPERTNDELIQTYGQT